MQVSFRRLITTASTVTALCPPTSISWGLVAQGAAPPAIGLHLIGNNPGLTLSGSDNFWSGRVQVDCCGQDYPAAKRIADAVIALLHGQKGDGFQVISLDAQRDYDETGAAGRPSRISLDFLTIWSK